MPDEVATQMILTALARLEGVAAQNNAAINQMRVDFAELGISPRLKALEDFKKAWEPKLWKTVGIATLLSGIGAVVLEIVFHH